MILIKHRNPQQWAAPNQDHRWTWTAPISWWNPSSRCSSVTYFIVFLLPMWLLKSKAYLKREIAARIDIVAGLLPYHDGFLNYLKVEHANGHRLFLATASNDKFTQAIVLNLESFHEVLASNASVNRMFSNNNQIFPYYFNE